MDDCIFCKIVRKEIPSRIVYEDENILAFEDIEPVAPVHLLIIPKIHISSLNEVNDEHKDLIADIIITIKELAKELELSEDGYRVVNNCGDLGGQTVNHLHFHLVGERQMKWPPG